MDEHEVIGSAFAPGGVELRLVRSDDDFAILLRDNELMSTDIHASEEALATLTCQHLAGCPAPQLLIGGYGMGFTLRAALAALEDDASVVVAELVPEIIEWALGPYGGYQAIKRDPETGVYYGASESRKDGQAAGY